MVTVVRRPCAYTALMPDTPSLSRSLLRRAENTELALVSLSAITEIREILDSLEEAAVESAREKGATMEDIADALNLTKQAIYYRFRRRNGHRDDAD